MLPHFRKGMTFSDLSAIEMNQLVQAVRQNMGLTSDARRRAFDPLTELWVVNKTGAKLKPFYVVGLRNANFDPDVSEELVEFERVVVMEGHTPDIDEDRNEFGIILEGTEGTGDEIVRCLRTGIVQAYINVRDDEDKWTEVKDGDITQLNSSVTGMARIMWKQSGTGTKRGLVWLNAHHMGMREDPLTDLSSGWDQEDQDSPRKEGVKFQVITVNDDYVAGANETVRSLQYDSHGHLVLIDDQGESSSSPSSVSASSVSASSASSDSGADSLPSDSNAALNCSGCAYDYILVDFSFGGCDAGACVDIQSNAGIHRLAYLSSDSAYCYYEKNIGSLWFKVLVRWSGGGAGDVEIIQIRSVAGGSGGTVYFNKAPVPGSPTCGDTVAQTQFDVAPSSCLNGVIDACTTASCTVEIIAWA